MHQCAMSTSVPGNGSDLGIRQAWLPLFDKYEVDLVLSGHEHDYERSYPVRGYDAGPHGTVETLSGLPHDGRAEVRRPPCDVLVVADDGHGERDAGGYDVRGHGTDEPDPLGIRQGGAEPTFGLVERLNGDEDDLGPQPGVEGRRRVPRARQGRLRHRASVRVNAEGAPGPP